MDSRLSPRPRRSSRVTVRRNRGKSTWALACASDSSVFAYEEVVQVRKYQVTNGAGRDFLFVFFQLNSFSFKVSKNNFRGGDRAIMAFFLDTHIKLTWYLVFR